MSQLWKGLEHILMPLCMSAKYLSYLFSEVLLSPSYAVKVVGLFIMTRISLWIVLFSNCSVFFRPSVLSTSAALHVAHEWMLWEQSLEICQGGKVNKMSKPVVGIFDNSAGSQQVQLKGGYWCFFCYRLQHLYIFLYANCRRWDVKFTGFSSFLKYEPVCRQHVFEWPDSSFFLVWKHSGIIL